MQVPSVRKSEEGKPEDDDGVCVTHTSCVVMSRSQEVSVSDDLYHCFHYVSLKILIIFDRLFQVQISLLGRFLVNITHRPIQPSPPMNERG